MPAKNAKSGSGWNLEVGALFDGLQNTKKEDVALPKKRVRAWALCGAATSRPHRNRNLQ